jgi:hypothetical protein
MADPMTLPLVSLHYILAHLETARMVDEEASEENRLDPVCEHAAKVREWLSSIDNIGPGLAIVEENADGTETSYPIGNSGVLNVLDHRRRGMPLIGVPRRRAGELGSRALAARSAF